MVMYYKLLQVKIDNFESYMDNFELLNEGKYYEILSITNCEVKTKKDKKDDEKEIYVNIYIRSRTPINVAP